MEKIKQNLAVKVAAFILLQAFVLMTVLSAIVIVFNVNYGWYTQSEANVKKNILHETAFTASVRMAGTSELMQDKGEELLYSEKDAKGFGYKVYLYDAKKKDYKGKTIRQLHTNLLKEPNVYKETFYHSAYVTDIYLSDTDAQWALPQQLNSTYLLYQTMYQYRNYVIAGGIAGILGTIALFVFLMAAAGHRKDPEGNAVKWIPMDLAAAAGLVILAGNFSILSGADVYSNEYETALLSATSGILIFSAVVTGFCAIAAVWFKKGCWWKHTIIYRIMIIPGKYLFSLLCRGIKKLPIVWKTAAATAVLVIINGLTAARMYYDGWAVMLWLLEAAAVSVCVIYIALCLKRLAEGAKRLADGDLSYQIDKNGLFLDLAQHAENLNSIGKGMSKAVDERLKSERFKAELITNVSHDIKTPLTSIINYVDFLKNEELDNEKAREYVEVLDRQSNRLKKLTEDLVDASKAATGNLKMEMAPCQVDVLMTQTMGEYKEKAEASDLQFVMKLPEEELTVMADGRRLWRVFDNLLNNICKYSQPGTRVYLDLKRQDGKAVIIYRNTSRYELNITAEELTERFVRGDSSRHTEGSGLGLSIAQNLVELQGGNFHITIDGDLFKVTIEFDLL